jgi:tripartite-type tricarboxylate transporter receptor subunit TctC
MSIRKCSVFALLLAMASPPALAQEFPARPMKVVVALSAGGVVDLIARLLSPKLSDIFKQPVVVENRPGGSGIPGYDLVAKSPADGHTLLLGTTGLVMMHNFFPKLPFDPRRDFAPVTIVADSAAVLVVHASVPARNMKELIGLAKASPGRLYYGSSGNGGVFHLSGELLKSQTGIDIVHVPYKGNARAMVDLLAGQVQILFANPPDVLAHIKAGKLHPIVWTGSQRTPLLPEVPTVAEAGLANAEAKAFFALVVPSGTPKQVIARLNAETVKVLKLADVHKRLVEVGLDPVGSSSEQAQAFLRSEEIKWAKVIKESGAKVDN